MYDHAKIMSCQNAWSCLADAELLEPMPATRVVYTVYSGVWMCVDGELLEPVPVTRVGIYCVLRSVYVCAYAYLLHECWCVRMHR